MSSVVQDNQNPLSNQKFFFNEINTKISDYSLDDILNMLEIKLDNYEDYKTFREDTNKKINQYIDMFEQLKNNDIVDFFKEIQKSLFGDLSDRDNITEAQKLLEIYNERDKMIKSENIEKTIEKNRVVYRETVTKLLTIDSRFRSNYASTLSTDFDVNLPYIINNVTEIRLSDVEFPATFYPFQEEYENNYFWLKYTFLHIAQIQLIVIQSIYIFIYLLVITIR